MLTLSDQLCGQKDYSSSALYLKSALLFSLDNPLLTPEVKKTDITGRIEKLKPFLSEGEFTQLDESARLVNGRSDDLSELKVGKG